MSCRKPAGRDGTLLKSPHANPLTDMGSPNPRNLGLRAWGLGLWGFGLRATARGAGFPGLRFWCLGFPGLRFCGLRFRFEARG